MKMLILFSLIVFTELCGQRITKIYAPDPAQWDRFGRSVAMNSDYLAISSSSRYSIVGEVGAVYLYKKNADEYKYFKKLIPGSFYSTVNYFGYTIHLSEGAMFVGSKDRVHIYGMNDTVVTLRAIITPPDTTQYYGYFFSQSDKDLIVGAYLDDISSRGAAYFYSYTDPGWVYKQKIKPDNLRSNSHFGRSSAFNDKYAVISAIGDGIDNGPRRGSVFLFEKTDTGWIERQKILPPTDFHGQLFGKNLILTDSLLIISSQGGYLATGYHGRVYVYALTGNKAILQDSLFAPETYQGNNFGASLAFRNDSLLVGMSGPRTVFLTNSISFDELPFFGVPISKESQRNGIESSGHQSSYLLVYNGRQWEYNLKLEPTDLAVHDVFGYSGDFIDKSFIIGAPGDSTYADWSGAAYLFQPNLVSAEEIHDGSVREFELMQNYPNPFNPTTDIIFTLPSGDNVRIVVYDLLGKEITTLAEGYLPAGRHTVKFNAFGLSSGIYFYSLQTKDCFKVKKLTVMK